MVSAAAVVLAVAAERLVELRVARRNAAWSRARGGREFGAEHYPLMVALHAAYFIGCLLEPILLRRPAVPTLAAPMLLLVLAAQSLRWWCMATLGPRWNTRVIVIPGLAPIRRGPYRWLRHPNYLAVVVEGIALPLLGTAWITALAFTVANTALLRERIRVEEAALAWAEKAGP